MDVGLMVTGCPAASAEVMVSAPSVSTPTTCTCGRRALIAAATPVEKPPPADRHEDVGEIRHVLDELQPDGAVAGNDDGVVIGVQVGAPAAARSSALAKASAAVSHELDRRAVTLRLVDVEAGGDARHQHQRVDPEGGRAARHGDGVVAARHRDDAARALRRAMLHQLVGDAARLERARLLQALELHGDLAAETVAQGRAAPRRRAANMGAISRERLRAGPG